MPRYAANFVLGPLDAALQPAVGESVLRVEFKRSFVTKIAAPGIWLNPFYIFGGNNRGREIYKVFLSRLQLKTSLGHGWKL